MKLLVIIPLLILFPSLTAFITLSTDSVPYFDLKLAFNGSLDSAGAFFPGFSDRSLAAPPDLNPAAEWTKAQCRGERLYMATILDHDGASKHVKPLDSKWNGGLMEGMKT